MKHSPPVLTNVMLHTPPGKPTKTWVNQAEWAVHTSENGEIVFPHVLQYPLLSLTDRLTHLLTLICMLELVASQLPKPH
jgi:hypothetical protein